MVSVIEVRELSLTLMLIAGISGALLVLDFVPIATQRSKVTLLQEEYLSVYPVVSIHVPEHNIFAPQE